MEIAIIDNDTLSAITQSRTAEKPRAMTVIELARAADVTPHVVRHYTRIGLLNPERDEANGYKLFGEADLKRLLFIRRAKLLGYRLSEIRSILDESERGQAPCPKTIKVIAKRIEKSRQLIHELTSLQIRMEQALAGWAEFPPDGVPSGDDVYRLIDTIMDSSGEQQ